MCWPWRQCPSLHRTSLGPTVDTATPQTSAPLETMHEICLFYLMYSIIPDHLNNLITVNDADFHLIFLNEKYILVF